jgi:alcohol dehydrogenase class IV
MSLSTLLDHNVIWGNNALERLKAEIEENNYQNILLISGEKSFELNGGKQFFEKYCDRIVLRISYSGTALPLEHIEKLYEPLIKINKVDLIIGIGGGTILDLTKVISLLYSNKISDINSIFYENLSNKINLILIPTTAGSGSEATSFAVIYKEKVKYSVKSNDLNIIKVILDPYLLHKLPENILKSTILDAFSQAIESLWARNSTNLSKKYSIAALRIFYQNLFFVYSIDNLKEFLLASYLAGKAINISKTTASHAISYPLTSLYSIPHGIAVYLTLPELLELNYLRCPQNPSFKLLYEIFEVKDIVELKNKLLSLFEKMGIKNKLKDYNIKKYDVEIIAQNSFNKDRLYNNPTELSYHDICSILERIFD